MKKNLLKDSWFQMFTAIAGVAYVVSALGTVSTHQGAAPATPPAAVPAAAKSAAAPAPAAAAQAPSGFGSESAITPSPRSSSDLATYSGVSAANGLNMVAPPAPASMPDPAAGANPGSPPRMTITGTGVGNTQGIVGPGVNMGGGGGALSGIISRFWGGGQTQVAQQAQPQTLPYNRVVSVRKGLFSVGASGMTGADTSSLRDAVFSAASGDLILVKPGIYEGPVEVLNKSLRIRGTGSTPGAVKVTWTGSGATISVRNGTLDLENVRVERGPNYVYPKTEPGGAVYATASTLTMRKVELSSTDGAAPPLIVEHSGKPTLVLAYDSRLSGSKASLLARGPVKVKLTRVSFESADLAIAAWLDAIIELVDCTFPIWRQRPIEISAYEGAHVIVSGKEKPRINTVRGSDATAIEETFGTKRVAIGRVGFARNIFARGRRPGTIP